MHVHTHLKSVCVCFVCPSVRGRWISGGDGELRRGVYFCVYVCVCACVCVGVWGLLTDSPPGCPYSRHLEQRGSRGPRRLSLLGGGPRGTLALPDTALLLAQQLPSLLPPTLLSAYFVLLLFVCWLFFFLFLFFFFLFKSLL